MRDKLNSVQGTEGKAPEEMVPEEELPDIKNREENLPGMVPFKLFFLGFMGGEANDQTTTNTVSVTRTTKEH